MKSTDFPEKNFTIRAGSNPNTVSLQSCLAARPDMPKNFFHVSRWEMDEIEMTAYKDRLRDIFESAPDLQGMPELIDRIAAAVPPVYLACMNAQVPVTLDMFSPFEAGWMVPMNEIAKKLMERNIYPEDN